MLYFFVFLRSSIIDVHCSGLPFSLLDVMPLCGTSALLSVLLLMVIYVGFSFCSVSNSGYNMFSYVHESLQGII